MSKKKLVIGSVSLVVATIICTIFFIDYPYNTRFSATFSNIFAEIPSESK